MTKARDLSQTPNASLGFKNRLINSDMRIDQRNNGASVTPVSSSYTLDRWLASLNVASKFSVQQNAGSVTPPDGFINYLGVTSTSAYSVGASDAFSIQQRIEGFNTADLAFGTSNAKSLTLSFWVRSSLTGTFGGQIYGSPARSYPFSYSIPVANTWTYITIAIAGDATVNTYNTTNGFSLIVVFGLGSGSSASGGTVNTWQNGNFTQPSSTVSVVGTSGATFYITGVQLEKGSTATSFDYRPYGTELDLCQRYYAKMSASASGVYTAFASGFSSGAASSVVVIKYPIKMRATPTLSLNSCAIQSNAGAITSATASTFYGGSDSGYLSITTTGQTTGQGAILIANNSAAAYLDLSSEL